VSGSMVCDLTGARGLRHILRVILPGVSIKAADTLDFSVKLLWTALS
jgi:hypothetical protein